MKNILLVLFLSSPVFSQVVNIESKRIRTDTIGWSGSAEANFMLSKVSEEIYDLGAKIHFQHKGINHLWLFLNEYRVIKGAGTDFINSGFAHVRYNHKITKELLRWEVFSQLQFNGALAVRLRGLIGTGPRFRIYERDEFRIYAGSLYMFEYTENTDKTIFERNHRNSSYVSLTVDVKRFNLTTTTYYQPLLRDFKDYIFYSQTELLFEITEQLDFKTGFTFRYDSNPFPGIPKKTYFISNGLVFSF
ncbi:MAG: DUF481 domain-containing protein [Ignavibacteria bacterium]|nr:DUF481 domain-containing protein [Ignavibacteria bacterium]